MISRDEVPGTKTRRCLYINSHRIGNNGIHDEETDIVYRSNDRQSPLGGAL